MSITLAALRTEHATEAANIHVEGQPGTFLTSLGTAFLKALYIEMANSSLCFGHVALNECGSVVGIVVGSGDANAVFKQMIWRRGWRLVGPLALTLLKRPRLIGQIWETLAYPGQASAAPKEAELFFIGTSANARRQGVGSLLFRALAEDARQRGHQTLGLTVDHTNDSAQRFYKKHGMRPEHTMVLYGRTMYWYTMPLSAEGEE